MHHQATLSVLLLLSLAGCATARNYLEPDRPIHESRFGVPGDPEGTAPSVIRIVTFNIQHGRRIGEAVERAGVVRDTGGISDRRPVWVKLRFLGDPMP